MRYDDARAKMQPGDLIGFSGTGLVSAIIKLVTVSDISHVGIILKSTVDECQSTVNQLIESTSLGEGYAGVKISRVSDYIWRYRGALYWYPLTDKCRNTLDIQKMCSFLLSHNNKRYDTPQAILSALNLLPDSKEDFTKMYCSELVAGGYEAGGLLNDINCSTLTPADVLNMDFYKHRVKLN